MAPAPSTGYFKPFSDATKASIKEDKGPVAAPPLPKAQATSVIPHKADDQLCNHRSCPVKAASILNSQVGPSWEKIVLSTEASRKSIPCEAMSRNRSTCEQDAAADGDGKAGAAPFDLAVPSSETIVCRSQPAPVSPMQRSVLVSSPTVPPGGMLPMPVICQMVPLPANNSLVTTVVPSTSPSQPPAVCPPVLFMGTQVPKGTVMFVVPQPVVQSPKPLVVSPNGTRLSHRPCAWIPFFGSKSTPHSG
ncbi:hypothetical protein NN561_019395 [Cricetulus griseus]